MSATASDLLQRIRGAAITLLSVTLIATTGVGMAAADDADTPPNPTPAEVVPDSDPAETEPEPEPAPTTPVVAVTASAPTSAYLHAAAKATGKVSVDTSAGTVTLQLQASVGGTWQTKATTTAAARAAGTSFSFPLDYGSDKAGSYKWRVMASVPATDTTLAGSATSGTFTLKRVAQSVTFKAATVRRVGKTLTATGALKGFSGAVTVKTQAYVSGKWVTKNTLKLKKGTTSYKVDLAYGLNKAGNYTWRVVATSGSQTATSAKLKIQRVPLRAVSGTAARTAQIGSTLTASGKVLGYNGKVTVSAQAYVGGKWVTKKTAKVTAKYAGTSYKVALPYAANKRGTVKWRIHVTDGSYAKTSAKFSVTRVAGTIDSRCLTGRALCVSKKDRKVRWMINGELKQTFDARFGSSSTPTRNGGFKVGWKSRNHVSSLYHTAMPFAMFFSGGQAIHYSADFAARGYNGASHGCVNIRDYNGIKKLFDTVRVGDKVIVY